MIFRKIAIFCQVHTDKRTDELTEHKGTRPWDLTDKQWYRSTLQGREQPKTFNISNVVKRNIDYLSYDVLWYDKVASQQIFLKLEIEELLQKQSFHTFLLWKGFLA